MLTFAQVIEEDIEGARLGDQLAGARIAEVGRLYRTGEGGAQIKASYDAILAYLDSHPANDDPGNPTLKGIQVGHDANLVIRELQSPFGAETPALLTILPTVGGRRAMTAAIVALAGQSLPPNAIELASQAYTTPEARDTFITAATNPLAAPLMAYPEEMQPYAAAGHILGYAIRLQAIRNGAPLTIFSPDMAWEFGY